MNTTELTEALSGDAHSAKLVPIVCPRDAFFIDEKPRLFVVNTDPSSRPGEHWLAIFTDAGGKCFFDSYGRDVSSFPDIHRKLGGGKVVSNKVPVQGSTTNVCGDYCTYVCLQLARGWRLADIVDALLEEPDTDVRDHAIRRLTRTRIPELEARLRAKKAYVGVDSVHIQHAVSLEHLLLGGRERYAVHFLMRPVFSCLGLGRCVVLPNICIFIQPLRRCIF